MVIPAITLILIALAILILFSASLNMGWGLYLPAITRLSALNKEVMLTFDDGPHPVYTPLILDILKEKGVHAIFFCIGEKALENPGIVVRMINEGHKVGIHTMNHSVGFTVASKLMAERDLDNCRKILSDITGTDIVLFRPPFGVTNPNIAKAVKRLKLKTIGWSIRSFDTIKKDEQKVISKVGNELHNGAIILLHDRLYSSAGILKGVLEAIEKQNYKTTII
jgi:peptidoglycan/xylan/chitin deacetylase (PgdA/CDA1 family)